MYGDSAIRDIDDGSSGEIQLGADVVIFGYRNSVLYVSDTVMSLIVFVDCS